MLNPGWTSPVDVSSKDTKFILPMIRNRRIFFVRACEENTTWELVPSRVFANFPQITLLTILSTGTALPIKLLSFDYTLSRRSMIIRRGDCENVDLSGFLSSPGGP